MLFLGSLWSVALLAQTTRQSDFVLTGRVTMADGSTIPKPAAIERYCASGRATWEARTDKNGNYIVRGFDMSAMGSNWRSLGVGGEARYVLRASLPGYQSSNIDFMDRRFGSDTNLPAILLYRRGSETSSLLEAGSRVPRAMGQALTRQGDAE